MKSKILQGLLILAFCSTANAVIISVNDWSHVGGVDTGTTLFQVTETFTTAAELGGTQSLYEYTFENMSDDLIASLFRVTNPDDLSRNMSGPSDWSERSGAQNFVWETSNLSTMVGPGDSLGGFQVFTDGVLPDLTFASYGFSGAGWIMAHDDSGARVDVHGELIRQIPEPGSIILLGLGLFSIIAMRHQIQPS